MPQTLFGKFGFFCGWTAIFLCNGKRDPEPS